MATLVSEVRLRSGSSSTITSDTNIVTFLQGGANYCVASIPKELLWFMAREGSSITDANGYGYANSDIIYYVKRDGKACVQVPVADAWRYGYSGSLYQATTFFPVYYIDGSKSGGSANPMIYILPSPTTLETGVVAKVGVPSMSTISSRTSDNLEPISEIIITYAAALDLLNSANYYADKDLVNVDTGEATDALSKAKLLVDTAASVGGDTLSKSAQGWLSDEDSEMVRSTIETAAQEINRARVEIERSGSLGNQASVYYTKAERMFLNAKSQLEDYINSDVRFRFAEQAGAR